MREPIPGVMLAAVKSGSGKTTITCALLAALKKRGISPRAFKCGPDYIDPMFHRTVIGIPSQNLDSFFLEPDALSGLYAESMRGGEVAVVEGAMGLFDGLGGVQEEGSAYHVASVLGLPIILIVDAHGMGHSLLPLLAGFLQYDTNRQIAGVLLNKISASFYQTVAPLIEAELQLPVLGFLPKTPELSVESRHLGLKMPEEISGLRGQVETAAQLLEKYVSVERILELAGKAGAAKRESPDSSLLAARHITKRIQADTGKIPPRPVKIGVARDEAFCFYYEENLTMLQSLGAELVFFSPLHDRALPEGLSGILLGGGYPELYAKQLEENRSMRRSVRAAILAGMPSVAECGGFLYLHDVLTDKAGITYEMCGVIPGRCFDTGKLVRFGYLELEETAACFLPPGARIRGHEFHYYDSENNGSSCTARKPVTGKSWACVHSTKRSFWGFPHLYYPSEPAFARHFLEEARAFASGFFFS